MKTINSAVKALIAWYEMPEEERASLRSGRIRADEKRDLLMRIAGHLSPYMMVGNLEAALRILWTAPVSDNGYDGADLSDALLVLAEFAALATEAALVSETAEALLGETRVKEVHHG